MNDIVKIFALGGLDENGRDCYVVEINDDIFVLDCGTSIPDKTMPGVDYVAPNPDYLIKNKDRIKAYLLSHGHDEAVGALKYFYKKAPAPIYGSKETLGLVKANANLVGIDMSDCDYHIVEPSSVFEVAGREIRFIQTCHNIASSSAIAIYTTQGYIVYTGDFIVDFVTQNTAYHFDLAALGELRRKENILVLLSESKCATKRGYCAPKHRTTLLIEKNFKDSNRRIFFASFWQNSYCFEEMFELCKRYGKKVFCYNEFTRKIIDLSVKIYPALTHGVEIVNKEDLLRVREKDLVILILGKEDDLFTEIELLAAGKSPDKRIVLTENDVFINSCIPMPVIEMKCTRSMDMVFRTGCEVNWIKKDQLVTMHAHEDDLRFLLSVLKPKYYFPVRGNFISLMANAKLALSLNQGFNHSNIFVVDNGMQIEFGGVTRPRIIPNEANGIVIDPLLIDGQGLSKNGPKVVADRLSLGQDGVVVIAGSVDLASKKVVAGPDCQMRGFVFVKEAEPLLKSLSSIYLDEINTAFLSGEFDKVKVCEAISDRCLKFIKRENGREPYILPIIDIIE